ncbi:MAG TPA: hypothetical protein VEX35_15375 [Allosphingosinicella sp.]|nr:hypothetical protein [Allosphingosinicella sp.]
MRLWDSVKAAASGVEDDGSFDSPGGPDDCEARRAAAFAVTAEDLDLPDDWGARPYGVVVEVGGPRGITTVVAFATGESSLLTSAGSGIIGRPSHVHVVVQAKRLVQRAADHVPLLEATTNFPYPPAGAIRFYFLTRHGILTAEEGIGPLRSGQRPLSSLLEVGDELVSEFLQYGWADRVPVAPPKPVDLLKPMAIVVLIAALTYAAWLIPIAWLRWPAVAIGAFFTIAALIVPFAMLTAPRLAADGPGEGTPSG